MQFVRIVFSRSPFIAIGQIIKCWSICTASWNLSISFSVKTFCSLKTHRKCIFIHGMWRWYGSKLTWWEIWCIAGEVGITFRLHHPLRNSVSTSWYLVIGNWYDLYFSRLHLKTGFGKENIAGLIFKTFIQLPILATFVWIYFGLDKIYSSLENFMNAESFSDQTRMPEGGHADGAINANDQSCSWFLRWGTLAGVLSWDDDQFVEMLLNFQLSTVDQIECFNQRSLLPCPRNFLFDAHQSYLVTRQWLVTLDVLLGPGVC